MPLLTRYHTWELRVTFNELLNAPPVILVAEASPQMTATATALVECQIGQVCPRYTCKFSARECKRGEGSHENELIYVAGMGGLRYMWADDAAGDQ